MVACPAACIILMRFMIVLEAALPAVTWPGQHGMYFRSLGLLISLQMSCTSFNFGPDPTL